PNIIRKLGHLERYQSAQHLLRAYLACAVSCRYAMPDALLATGPSSPILEAIVERAFAQAILEHPLFQVGLANEDSKKPSWVRLDRIDLHNHIEWRTVADTEDYDDVLREVLDWQVNHRFTHLETLPRWRSVILKSASFHSVDIVFAWDHAAGDGMSGKIFHQSLLTALNAGSDEKYSEPLKDRSFDVLLTALPPPVEKLLKLPVSCGFLLTEGWHTLRPPSLALDFPYAVKWAPVQPSPCTTRLSLVVVTEEILQGVLVACRQHQTTLTGLLHTLILVSMATRLPEDKVQAFQTGTPLCLRRFISPSPEEYPDLNMEHTVGMAVTYWHYRFDKDIVTKVRQLANSDSSRADSDGDLGATVWSAATALKQELSKKLESIPKNDAVGLTRFVGDWRSFVEDRAKTPRETSWELSNLGVIDGEVQKEKEKSGAGENWTIERAVYSQSASVSGPAICMNPVAVKGKGLVITCVWQVEVIEDQLVRGLSSDLETWLNGLGEKGRLTFDVHR
ncbi:hypothetical protein CONLIGDRAFT_691744, partial [Coniochaeta ligniaria NRRL 30616]